MAGNHSAPHFSAAKPTNLADRPTTSRRHQQREQNGRKPFCPPTFVQPNQQIWLIDGPSVVVAQRGGQNDRKPFCPPPLFCSQTNKSG